MTERVCVGAIAGAFGVQGDVRLKSFCGNPEDIATYGPLTNEDGTRSFKIRLKKSVKNGFAARLSEVVNREAAEALRGTRLYAERDKLPDLPEDEYYHADLIGLTVLDTGGTELGRVKAVLKWLSENYTLEENPGLDQQGLYYYYHAMAKALAAANIPTLETKAGKKVDWRAELAVKVINSQKENGSWINETPRWMESDRILVTSYAVMTLEQIHATLR